MRYGMVFALSVASLVTVSGGASAFDAASAVNRTTLPNGLRVWHVPRPGSPSVAIGLAVRAGSRYETLENNGISHFLEHMIFQGNDRWDEAGISRAIARLGGEFNGETGEERCFYYAAVPSDKYDAAVDWLAKVVFRCTLPVGEMERERDIIFRERGGRWGRLNNTFEAWGLGDDLGRRLQKELYAGTSLALSVDGEDESLDAITHEDLVRYYRSHYVPANALLVVVGGVTFEQAREAAQRYFGSVARGAAPPPPATPPPLRTGPLAFVIRGPAPTDQCTLATGVVTVGEAHPDRWPLAVLSEYLRSDLMEEVRFKRGLAYYVSVWQDTYRDTGRFTVWTTAEHKNLDSVQQIIQDRIEVIRAGRLDADKVAEAKMSVAGRHALHLESNLSEAHYLADLGFLYGETEPLPDYREALNRVQAADLARVVQTYFTPEQSFTGKHIPLVTTNSGAVLGVSAGIVVAAGVGYRRHRRRRRKHLSEALYPYPLRRIGLNPWRRNKR